MGHSSSLPEQMAGVIGIVVIAAAGLAVLSQTADVTAIQTGEPLYESQKSYSGYLEASISLFILSLIGFGGYVINEFSSSR